MADQEAASGPVAPKQEGKVINVSVKDQLGGEVHFKIKSTTKFEKVWMQAYRQGGGAAAAAVPAFVSTQHSLTSSRF
jgi:hypothetical protein